VPLPRAACEAWQRYGANRCQNAGLVFDRFAPRWDNVPSRQVGAIKQQGLNAVRQAAEKADRSLVAAWNQRWQVAARFVGAEPFTAKTDWRLITGLGRKGPLEVGFTFHRYGLPYLPGSSLKGLARARGLYTLAARLGTENVVGLAAAVEQEKPEQFTQALRGVCREAEPEPEALMLAEDFRAIFGTTGAAGGAVFLDGIPEPVPKLDLDIMNPHFPDYYRDGTGKTAPTDWQSPVPVFFLIVAAGTSFCFAVGWRGPRKGEWQRLRDQAVTWLRQGLEELGVGGKTGAGYGFFLPAATPPTTPEAVPATVARPSPTSATASAQPVVAADATPSEPALEWHTGTVRKFNAQRQRGRLHDDETGKEWHYSLAEVADRARTPGRGQRVRYALSGREGEQHVVRVERLS
jgi:CRISPR-associated protein Cmr6